MNRLTKYALKKGIKYAAKKAGKNAKEFAVNTAKEAALMYVHASSEQDLMGKPFRKMREKDRQAVFRMMRAFYTSSAVLSNGSEEIYNNDITACISENPYLEGFVFIKKIPVTPPEEEAQDNDRETTSPAEGSGSMADPQAADDGNEPEDNETGKGLFFREEILGYAMLAHSFSTEFGKPCLWLEDLFLKREARGQGLATQFISFLSEAYPDHLIRLEAEHENERAMEVYKRNGFSELPYVEMIK